MDDSELQAIRAARMKEMQQANKTDTNTNSVLNQVLETAAKERLDRVRMVKPDRAAGVENYLLRLAQSGNLRGKVTDKDVVAILGQLSQQQAGKIVFERREFKVESEDDESDDFFD
ncbi:Sdd2 protein [Martiniozyma asiatica (nom. inval.)]|nr:Sdd2 protein [Martiniozyma asiatica]